MSFSTLAWKNVSEVYKAIIEHPFNQELAQGTLSKSAFACYIEQDSFYLNEFARCHAIVASKIPTEHVRTFLAFSDYTFIAEQEIVHQFFNQLFQFTKAEKCLPPPLAIQVTC